MEIMFIWIWSLLFLLDLETNNAYTIDYWDCNSIEKTHRYEIENICSNDDLGVSKLTDYSILQIVEKKDSKGFSCQITRSTFLFFCGAFSHFKIMDVPDIQITEPINSMECRNLVNRKTYTTPDGKTHPIKLQGVNLIKSEDLGLIKDGDNSVSCQGEKMKVGQNIIDNVLKVSQFTIIVRAEEYSVDNKDRVEVTSDHIKLPRTCKVSQGGCQTALKTYFWTPPSKKCKFQELRRVKMKQLGNYLIDDKTKVLLKVLGKTPSPSKCPTATLFLTEYHDIFLTTNQNFPKFGTTIEIDTFITSLADYTLFHAEQAIQKAISAAKSQICQQKYELNDNKIHALGDGHFSSRNGDVLYLFQCKMKTGKIDPKEQCYADIPIEGGFVSSADKLLIKTSSPVRCNKNFPQEIRTKEGWITLTPTPTKVQPPMKMPLKHYLINHEDLVGGGLYTSFELTSWRNHLEDRNFGTALMGTLSYGVCVNEGECADSSSTSGSTNFDLTRLNPVNLVENLNIWEKLDQWVKTYSAYLSLVVILIETTKLATMIIIFVTTLIQNGLGGLWSIIFLTCCGDYQKVKRRAKRLKQSSIHMEMSEDVGASNKLLQEGGNVMN